MDTSPPIAPELCGRRQHAVAAFSLVEVTLAIGIVAFAFVGVFGLVPVGLNTFRQSMNTSLGTQIIQRVATDLQQSDSDTLVADASGKPITASSGCKALRYFDDQGNELQAAQSVLALYVVNTRIVPATTLPTGNAANLNLTTGTVQVAMDPAAQPLVLGSDNLWTGARQNGVSAAGSVPIMTEAIYVARNSATTGQ